MEYLSLFARRDWEPIASGEFCPSLSTLSMLKLTQSYCWAIAVERQGWRDSAVSKIPAHVRKSQHAVSGFHYGAAGEREWVCFVIPQQQILFHFTIFIFHKRRKRKTSQVIENVVRFVFDPGPFELQAHLWQGGWVFVIGNISSALRLAGPKFIPLERARVWWGRRIKEFLMCWKKVSQGGGSHAEMHSFVLGRSCVGSWMPTTTSPGVNLLQDPCGVCIRIRKGKSLWLLDLCILKLSRFIAALTCCSFLSTEYVFSAQCRVCCLGKCLCDSLEFLDVSNAFPAMKKTFLVFCNTECLRRRCLFLMPFEHFPSVSQAYIFLMELFMGMKIIPHLWNGASLDDVALQNRLGLASFSPLWVVWCAWAQIHSVLK